MITETVPRKEINMKMTVVEMKARAAILVDTDESCWTHVWCKSSWHRWGAIFVVYAMVVCCEELHCAALFWNLHLIFSVLFYERRYLVFAHQGPGLGPQFDDGNTKKGPRTASRWNCWEKLLSGEWLLRQSPRTMMERLFMIDRHGMHPTIIATANMSVPVLTSNQLTSTCIRQPFLSPGTHLTPAAQREVQFPRRGTKTSGCTGYYRERYRRWHAKHGIVISPRTKRVLERDCPMNLRDQM